MAVREDEEDGKARGLEPRPFRPFKTHEEYLWAMKEDLAEWLQSLYGVPCGPEDFMDHMETGSLLCRHANSVIGAAGGTETVQFRPAVQPGTFHARDNVSNFISWCRRWLKVKECLLFETDDLVMRKNEKNVVLCLLEVARKGVPYGVPAPLLVQMEREIDAEIAEDGPSSLSIHSDAGHEADDECGTEPEPRSQIVTNDLRSLHERVAELLNRCSCPSQFPMLRVGDGKYRIGESQLLIFVRILRNHVMVRVGGGWDTLEHYLDKHDPCRCRPGRRVSISRMSPSNSSSGSLQVHLNSHRPLSSPSSSSRSSSVPTSPPSRRRSFDLSRLSSPEDHRQHNRVLPNRGEEWTGAKNGRPSSADSSSESDTYRGDFLRRQRRYSPRKVMRVGTCSEEEFSSLDSRPRSRIPTSQSPSPRHREKTRLSSSRSETSLFQSPCGRNSRLPNTPRRGTTPQGCRQRSSSSTRTPPGEWGPKRRTLSLQSSPVKPVPPLLEEILNDSEVLDSDEKILKRMEKLINEYRAREDSPDADSSLTEDYSLSQGSPCSGKMRRRSSLSRIPVFAWHARQ